MSNEINSSFPDHLIGQNLKEKYDFICPECSTKLWAKPSMLMSLGINRGGAKCLKCGSWLQLSIDNNNESMIATKHTGMEACAPNQEKVR